MSKELTIRIQITPEMVHAGVIAALLAVFPASVGSETVTLQTYYPAPYGIYTQMRSMGNTTLAETSGSVGIGLGAGIAPTTKLDVKGDARFTNNVTFGGPTAPSPASISVGGAVYVPGYNMGLASMPPPSIAAEKQIASGQYLYAGRGDNCAPLTANQACGGYATWVPGVAIQGTWHDSRVGMMTTAGKNYAQFGFPTGAVVGANLRFNMTNPGTGESGAVPYDYLFDTVQISAHCCTY